MIAGLLLTLVFSAGLVVLAELLDTRLRARQDFELVAGVPVIARLPSVDPIQPWERIIKATRRRA